MNAGAPLRFGKGVKLRRDGDGGVMLLVPEGVLELNRPAAAALELVNGERTLDEIVEAVVERFDVAPETARAEIADLVHRLTLRGFILRQPFDSARGDSA